MTLTRALAAFGVVLLGVVIWSSIGPSQFGGPVTIAVTRGSSMAPVVNEGDLVFVRRATNILPGDLVLYHSRETGRDVLHRVVRVSDGRYVTKGDANDWLDEDRPTAAEIRGVLWWHVPGAGEWVSRLQSPVASAVFGGLFLGLLAMSLTPTDEARRTPLHRTGLGPQSGLGTRVAVFAESLGADMVMGVLVGSALTGAVLTGWSLAQPTTEAGIDAMAYAHTADWSYRATESVDPNAGLGPAYEPESNELVEAELQTGQPIFPRLTPVVEHRVDYRFNAPTVTDVTGRARMYVVLREDTSGWHGEFELAPWEAFEGPEVTLSAAFDLRQAEASLRAFQEVTQVGGSVYRAVIAAEIEVSGLDTDHDHPHVIEDFYRTFIVYRYDFPRMIRVEQAIGATSGEVLAAGIDPLAGVFHQSATREHVNQVEVSRQAGILAWDVPIANLRVAGAVILVVTVFAIVGLYWLRQWADGYGAWFMIRARYGHRLALAPVPPLDSYDRGYVDVTDFDDILALADARYQPIIAVETEFDVEFYVMDLPNGIYRYRLFKTVPWESSGPDAPPAA